MLTNSIGFTLMDIARFFRHNFEDLLENAGLNLTVGEIRALNVVTASGAERQNNLAARLGVEPMTMSSYLDRLTIQGLITRSPDPTDGRAKIIKATDAGKGLGGKLSAITGEMEKILTIGLNASELITIEQVLLKMRNNLQSAAGAETPKLQEAVAA